MTGERPPGPDDAPGSADDEAIAFAHRMLDLARDGDLALLAYVDEGVPVGLTDAAGNTLLMLAAYHGHAGVVTGLAERGADVDRANDRGQTPLAGAVFKDYADVVRALRRFGADPDAGGPSAIESARFFDRQGLLPLLTQSVPPA